MKPSRGEQTFTSVKLESAIGIGFDVGISLEIKKDSQSNKGSITALSFGLTLGTAVGVLSYYTEAKGEIAAVPKVTADFSVNYLLGAGPLAAQLSEVLASTDPSSVNFESKYGLSNNSGITAIGIRSDFSEEAFIEVPFNPF